ncbi:hypothetical protein MMC31_007125, partial [Peltigera leucophlebia]|nr:hypothetical protein [Peltigera leucophlebia]
MTPSLSNRMSFDRVEKLKTLQQEPDDNAFVLQVNGKTFKSVSALNKFTETFSFGPDCLVVQIDAIEHCKQSASYSSRTSEQFIELIEPLLGMEKTFLDMRDRADMSLQTISMNWSVDIAKVISSEKGGNTCLRRIASVSLIFKNRYDDARNALNHVIIDHILSKKTRQSCRRYASLVDWTVVLNRSTYYNSLPPITLSTMLEARVCIGDYGILRAGIAQQSTTKTKELVKSSSDSEQRDTVSEDEDRVTSGKQAPISFKRSLPSNPNPADNASILKKRKTWSSCNHCRNLDAIPTAWQQEVERNDLIDMHV